MVDGEKSNKMSSANIAMIIAPNLFHPKGVPPPSPPQPHGFFSSNISLSSSGSSGRNNANNGSDLDPAKQFGIVAKLSEITRIMIVYSHLLFTVPPSFVRQIRQTHTTRTVSAALNGGNKTKERKIRRLDPRRIKVKAQQNLPALPESDKSESTFFQQQFPQ
ncbi:hypothetical protein BV898_19716 [Hypsibius exemplaris]|nr:hypothetical protein BV898_19716 [Hypsibius exemplaris]